MNREIVPDLDENIAYIEKRFEGCADAVMRRLWMGDEKLEIYVIYMDSMYDRDFVDGVLLKSLLFDVSCRSVMRDRQFLINIWQLRM